MVKLFVQGMRRSGTTIVFDILSQDPRFDAWYEPFSITREGRLGGGSGEQAVDFSARVLALRQAMCATLGGAIEPDFFNYGAPRDPTLELSPELPDACRRYLRQILDASTHTLIKFVRMYEKLAALRELAPDAKLIHVVRDPRSVATSQLLGPGGEKADRFQTPKSFFRRRGKGVLWASRALGHLLAERAKHAHLADAYDVRLILLVWRHTFRRTFDDGRRLFGDDYLLLRHEDLAREPRQTVERIYRWLDLTPEPGAIEFSERRTRPPRPPLFSDSDRWDKAIRKVDLQREMEEAGYA